MRKRNILFECRFALPHSVYVLVCQSVQFLGPMSSSRGAHMHESDTQCIHLSCRSWLRLHYDFLWYKPKTKRIQSLATDSRSYRAKPESEERTRWQNWLIENNRRNIIYINIKKANKSHPRWMFVEFKKHIRFFFYVHLPIVCWDNADTTLITLVCQL